MSSELAKTIEALLFLSSDPLSADELAEATGAGGEDLRAALAELAVLGAVPRRSAPPSPT